MSSSTVSYKNEMLIVSPGFNLLFGVAAAAILIMIRT
jgi:hypothetical protein